MEKIAQQVIYCHIHIHTHKCRIPLIYTLIFILNVRSRNRMLILFKKKFATTSLHDTLNLMSFFFSLSCLVTCEYRWLAVLSKRYFFLWARASIMFLIKSNICCVRRVICASYDNLFGHIKNMFSCFIAITHVYAEDLLPRIFYISQRFFFFICNWDLARWARANIVSIKFRSDDYYYPKGRHKQNYDHKKMKYLRLKGFSQRVRFYYICSTKRRKKVV